MILLLVALAKAATATLVLPPGQEASLWTAPAALADLRVGPRGGGAELELVETAVGWALIARDGAGDERRVAIAAPSTASAREDAIWLGSSLLASLPHAPGRAAPLIPLGGLPLRSASAPKPPPPPPAAHAGPPSASARKPAIPPSSAPLRAPAPPAPAAAPGAAEVAPSTLPAPAVAPPPVAEAAAAAPPTPEPPPPAEVIALPQPPPVTLPVPSSPPAPNAWRPVFWASLGPTVEARPDITAGGGLVLDGGLRLGDSAALGLGLRLLTPRQMPDIPSGVVDASFDPSLALWWAPEAPLAPVAGLRLGLSTRSHRQADEPVGRFVVPVGSLEAGAARRVGESLDLLLLGRVAADTSTTFIELGDHDPVPLSPWAFGGSLVLRGRSP